jgi:hypothetical protein
VTMACPNFKNGPKKVLRCLGVKVISLLSIGHNRLMVASKFLHCTILVTTSAKSFFQQNFSLNWTRILLGYESLMLFPL